MWSIIKSDAALTLALSLCRGCYQRALILGSEAVSGSTLRGKARRWGHVYKNSRRTLIARLRAAGVSVSIETIGRRNVLVIA